MNSIRKLFNPNLETYPGILFFAETYNKKVGQTNAAGIIRQTSKEVIND